MRKIISVGLVFVALNMLVSCAYAEGFGALFGDMTKEFESMLGDTAKEINSLFGADEEEDIEKEIEKSETEETTEEATSADNSGSFLGDISTIFGGLTALETGIPKTIHYGDYELFKKDIDMLEKYFQEYVDFMKNYDANDLSMIADYTSFMASYVEAMQVLDALDVEKMSAQETKYYNTVLLRINKLLYSAL